MFQTYSSSSSPGLEGTSSRAVNNYHYPTREEDFEYYHTAPPPLRQVTYGPASPVALHPRNPHGQLYHHRFAESHMSGKAPRQKNVKSDIHKYSAYIKHDKSKEYINYGKKTFTNREFEKPDYVATSPERDTYARRPQEEGFGEYNENYQDNEEKLYRESIGASYDDDRISDYSSEKRSKPYNKHQSYKHQKYVNENKYYTPVKNYNSYSSYESEPNTDHSSGFDDSNGGQVMPLIARFYKQPLPIIQTHLPVDNTGLFYVYPAHQYHGAEVSNNYYEQYPAQDRSSDRRTSYESDSEWTPINAPSGAKPARSYDIPAPNFPKMKSSSESVPVYRRDPESASVVVGKSKQAMTSNHHIQGNSEGVVSAVVRVKQ